VNVQEAFKSLFDLNCAISRRFAAQLFRLPILVFFLHPEGDRYIFQSFFKINFARPISRKFRSSFRGFLLSQVRPLIPATR
jgi:hypothetical protein